MKWLLLDRDGVINRDSDHFIRSLEEWIPIPGSLEAIARASLAGYSVAVLSNQSGIARGYLDAETVEAIHTTLQAQVEQLGGRVQRILYCPHGPQDECRCRKPGTGLFSQLADEFHVELPGQPVVGDSLRDLEAGVAVGCRPFLVRTGKGERTLAAGELPAGTTVLPDLAAVIDHLLNEENHGAGNQPD